MTNVIDITSDKTTTLAIATSDSIIHLLQGVVIDTVAVSIHEANTCSNNQIIIDGLVIGANGIHSYGDGTTIGVGAGGAVFGATQGMSIAGIDRELTNHGVIYSNKGTAISLGSSHSAIENHGLISGKTGLSDFGGAVTFTNEITGILAATKYGLLASSTSDIGWTIINKGEIRSGHYAISLAGNAADNFITNSGTISGIVELGAGNDSLDFRDGSVDGYIYLGAGDDKIDLRNSTVSESARGQSGDDLYIVSSKNIALTEDPGAGTDTVKSTASYTLADNFENLTLLGKAKRSATGNELDNVLTGNSGKNTIKGMAGDDTISGGRGNDKLIGGTGADVFIFANKGGHDRIMDFKPGQDSIDLSHLTAITSFSDLKQHHISAAHGDVIITAGKDVLILDGVKIGDLHKGDFDF